MLTHPKNFWQEQTWRQQQLFYKETWEMARTNQEWELWDGDNESSGFVIKKIDKNRKDLKNQPEIESIEYNLRWFSIRVGLC